MKLVCPHDRTLIDGLTGRTLCVRVDDTGDIATAAADARQHNTLGCVIVDASVPLCEIDIGDLGGIPVALMAPSMGRFRDVAKKLDALKNSNLRVYLPATGDNLTGARVLASLGVPVCITLDDTPDWEALADLMTYALLGMAPHAPLDPFRTIAEGYKQTARCDDWGRVYFDDPSRYLHLDADGRVALTRRELLAGQFIAADYSQLDSPAVARAIEQRLDAWRDMFAADHFCARCPAWRICRARVCGGKTAPDGCDAFFAETADVIEHSREKAGTKRQGGIWQP
jgi:hypothetical protein